MDARAQAQLLLSIVSLALAIAILLRPARSRLFVHFAAVNVTLCLWSLGLFLSSITSGAILPLRLTVASEALMPGAALGFCLEFLGDTGPRLRRMLRTTMIVGVTGAILASTSLLTMKPVAWSASPLRLAIGAWATLMLGVTGSLLYARMRQSNSRTERARLLYLVVGAGLSLGLTLVDVVTRDIAFPPLGTVTITAYVYFLSQTLQRYRLLDLNELLGKFVVLSLLATLLAAIYGVLVSWSVGFGNGQSDWTGLFLFNTLVASFVILILFDPLKAKIESAVVSLLFRERWEFLRTLQQLRLRIASLIDVREIAGSLLDALYESRRITHASIYLLEDDGLGFRRLDHRGPPPAAYLDAATARGIVNAAASGQKAVLIENIERRLFELRTQPAQAGTESDPTVRRAEVVEETARLTEIGAALTAMRTSVCIPIIGGDRVLGFFNLHDDRLPEAFASDEIAVLLEIAQQLSIAIENSRLYERMKERDRLAALGEMAAGLAHEIRNPLSSIKGAVQILDPRTMPPGESELVEVIVDEVNRLNAVVTQFLDYSRPIRSKIQAVAVNDLIDRTLKLLAGRELPSSVELRQIYDPELPGVNCDADQLKQVFINLAINAAQAMPKGGVLTVTTRRPRAREWHLNDEGPRYVGDQVEIRFQDTGPGIPDEARTRIFIPFYTTKEKGTGLGLAICQRIIKAHGGTIRVESKPGEGSTFVIRLPTNFDRTILEGTPLPGVRPRHNR